MSGRKSYKYINDFLFFVLIPDESMGKDAYLYCSGINIDRFLPITRGRHRPMSNPAIRGLQLVNVGVRALALANGATPMTLQGSECPGVDISRDSWSVERLLIKNAPGSLPDEIIRYCALELLKKIDKAIMLGAILPDKFLEADGLQLFIEAMCAKYGS
ncbi:MAG: hypothetical protein HZC49_10880 [Nitrospirae bacterium]|nr:hypothetical protein [Nitrospirota bacterium]